MDQGTELFNAWNCMAQSAGLAKIINLSDARMKHVRARMKDVWWSQNYHKALILIPASDFLMGDNERQWKANFDFFVRPDSVAKILEGRYNNKKSMSKALSESLPALEAFVDGQD